MVAGTATVLLLTSCAGVPGLYTVERSGDQMGTASSAFDAEAYAAKVWSDQIPNAVASAPPVADVFGALATDADAASTKYGHSQGTGSPWSFLVAGEGVVESVDTSGASVLLVLEQDYAPNAQVTLQVGPAFIGTAVRDALGTVKFSEFINQIDFADVATRLNDRVRRDVVADLDTTSIDGKTLRYVGAFALVDPSNIIITPIELEIVK